LTRGAFILLGFGAFLGLNLIFGWIVRFNELFVFTFYVAAILGIGSAIYSAFLFWQAKGRDFWQSPMFAVHLIVMALLAGSSTVAMIDDQTPVVRGMLFLALFLHGVVITLDLMAVHSTQDAKIAAQYVYRQNWMFWIGAVLTGILLPLGLLYVDQSGLAGLFALIGLLLYERVWVRAGQIVPLS
jgi:formate-dependent nitrite reductase membrane component NrfD